MINTQCQDKVKNGVTYVGEVASGLVFEKINTRPVKDGNLAEYIFRVNSIKNGAAYIYE